MFKGVDVYAHAHLYHLLPLQSLDLFGSSLTLGVAVTQFPVVPIAPAEHLARLGQRQRMAVRTVRRHQLSDYVSWRGEGSVNTREFNTSK